MDDAQLDQAQGDILIVDDTLPNLQVLSAMLTEHGYEVRGAPDGPTALMIAHAKPPDLILLDIRMPGMNGYEVHHRLKDKPETRDIPVIYISALGDVEDKVRGFELGGVDYIAKPFQVEEVLARVRTHISLHKLQTQLELQVRERTAELVHANARLKAEIAERQRAEEQVKVRLDEREVLLKEIHDRVKNNMQAMISLLNLQARYIHDDQILGLFKENQRRIHSMALVHDLFYHSPDLARIDFAGYIRQTMRNLFHQYKVDSGAIAVLVDAEGVFLDLRAAIPCGLIVNELVSNCIRHAFPPSRTALPRAGEKDKTDEICIEMHRQDDQVVLTVGDNGAGFPEDLDFRNAPSLGLQLIVALTGQLAGNIELDRHSGTAFKITFKA